MLSVLLIVAFLATPGAIPYCPARGAYIEGLLDCTRATTGTGLADGSTHLRFLISPPEYAFLAAAIPAALVSKFQLLAFVRPGPGSAKWVQGGSIHLWFIHLSLEPANACTQDSCSTPCDASCCCSVLFVGMCPHRVGQCSCERGLPVAERAKRRLAGFSNDASTVPAYRGVPTLSAFSSSSSARQAHAPSRHSKVPVTHAYCPVDRLLPSDSIQHEHDKRCKRY